MDIRNTTINTGMGKSGDWMYVPGLTEKDITELNSIGYSGKTTKGMHSTFNVYLNGLNNGYQYKVEQTKFDDGSFCESYLVTSVKKISMRHENWQEFYERRVNSTYQDYFNQRYLYMISLIKSLRTDNTIYELGCGIGSISKAVGGNFSGIDIDPRMVKLANINTDSNNFKQGSIFDFEYPQDVLKVSHGVLEHFNDDDIKMICENCPRSIHYVPLDKYVTPSFGDERLLPKEHWLELVEPKAWLTINDDHDLIFIL